MEKKEIDRALQVPAEANLDKHHDYLAEEENATDSINGENESIESRRKRLNADSGHEGSLQDSLQMEIRIDPGNEHHHRTDADDVIFDDDIDRSLKYDADAGGDGRGSVGPGPDE